MIVVSHHTKVNGPMRSHQMVRQLLILPRVIVTTSWLVGNINTPPAHPF
jgi:hypothetical protein